MSKKIINILIGLTIAGFIYAQFFVGNFMTPIEILIFLINVLISLTVVFFIARKKHLDIYIWIGLGFLLGIFVIPLILLWKPKMLKNINTPNNLSSQENNNQINSSEQISVSSKWLNAIFKIWAVIGFLGLCVTIIAIPSLLLSSVKILGELTKMSISYSLLQYGLYVGAFVLALIFLIPFWGAFKLRKWILPILFILSFFSAINILAILFKQPFQLSIEFIFSILWNIIILALTFLAFIFRHNFIGSFKKPVPQIIFFIFAIPILTIESLTLLFPDLPEISDSDLTVNKIVLPSSEESVYFSPVKFSEQIKEFLEDKLWDQTEVGLILSENKNVLTEMRKAAALTYYQCPTTTENISFITEEPCPHYLYLKTGRVASLSALFKAHMGDFRGAIEDALVPIHIGQLLIQKPRATLLDYLFGNAIKRIGLEALQIILTKYEIPSDILLSQTVKIEKYTQNNKEEFKNAFRLEYLTRKNELSFINKIDSNFYVQPNRFFTEMAEDIRQEIALVDIPCHQLDQAIKEHQKKFKKKIATWKLPFTRNVVLEVLKNGIMMDYSGAQTKRCENDSLVEQIRLQMAL